MNVWMCSNSRTRSDLELEMSVQEHIQGVPIEMDAFCTGETNGRQHLLQSRKSEVQLYTSVVRIEKQFKPPRENERLRYHLKKYLSPQHDFPGQVEFSTDDESMLVTFLTPELLDQEQQSRIKYREKLPDELQRMMNQIEQYLGGDESVGSRLCYQGGDLKPCGSMAEGTKILHADEFDFMYLIDVDGLQATPKKLMRTKPRSANGISRCYFSLTVPDARGRAKEIKANEIHDDFLAKIEAAVQPLNLDGLEVTKAGPAVKISYLSNGDKQMKVDLTLCLKSDPRRYMSHLTEFAKSCLEEKSAGSTPGQPDGTLRCHFVAAQDYWKLCFVETEQNLVKRLIEEDPVKGAVYRCIKILRDEADIKNRYGDGILPSYPIKVTFLDIANQERDLRWRLDDVCFHIIRILREVEYRGAEHRLCSLFLQGDDEMAEGDRSYLESRRVLKELKSRESVHKNTVVRPVALLGVIVLHIAILTAYRKVGLATNGANLTTFRVIFTLLLVALFKLITPMMKQLLASADKRPYYRIYPLFPLYSLMNFTVCLVHWGFLILPVSIVDERIMQDVNMFSSTFLLYLTLFQLGIITVAMTKLLLHERAKNESFPILSFSDIPPLLSFKWKPPDGEELVYIPRYPGEHYRWCFQCVFVAALNILISIGIIMPLVYVAQW